MPSDTASKSQRFPKYLPNPDEELLKWIGAWMQRKRGKKSASKIEDQLNLPAGTIEKLERGEFAICLGQLRDVLCHGYGCTLEACLERCYDAFRTKLDKKKSRPFSRDYHYRFCRVTDGNKPPTPVLIGGDPENFLWAVPFRRLKGQPQVVELLELSPKRTRNLSGSTIENSHSGAEMIFVIHGTIAVAVEGPEGDNQKELKREDSIHLNAKCFHCVANKHPVTPALLLIVRYLQPLSVKMKKKRSAWGKPLRIR